MSYALHLLEAFSTGKRRPLRILGASGQLGYGIVASSFANGMAQCPDMIGCDMGSTDIGPNYLGSGKMAPSRSGVKRDLRQVLTAARKADIPLVIGSAGSAGAKPHLEATLDILREVTREEGLSFTLAVLTGDIAPARVHRALAAGEITAMAGMDPLKAEDIDSASHIVAQMGMEAFARAYLSGADVIIAGRACDTAIFASLPVLLGFDAGPAIHMAKIIECASLCCVPGGRDTILATLDDVGFTLESMAPERAATPTSVAAHALYEQADPNEIAEPAGRVDLSQVRYEALDARRCRVSGARFIPTAKPRIKLEGASFLGYRAVMLAGVADPNFIAALDAILAGIEKMVAGLVCAEGQAPDYRLHFHRYGIDGVTPAPPEAPLPREMFLLTECLAPTQERAAEVIRSLRQYLLHYGFPGRTSTAGNLAFPFTPPELDAGPTYRFSLYHLMDAPDQAQLFPVEIERIGA
ncbi:acyclic terpene utilization AtuA family protein [Paracoccus sp. (in: a-proteobacteria)]|uniref:acyclic terpene utilization AtuA family protein n=1 Tax=Paracoccus sp. TaxID=267 RepID=UPI002AFEDD61|nr:acyclic terpene utilization AtuA family protein [Paracoccus sp. (in: a-proteobacteria)]